MKIRDFQPADFQRVVLCYREGFPEGHNEYTLARLVRWFEGEGERKGSILVAEDQGRVVGVIIGITTHWRAWMTGLAVLPERSYQFSLCSIRLLLALSLRLSALGYREAYATTGRSNVKSLADFLGAVLIGTEPDFFFNGQTRWIYRADFGTLQKLRLLLGRRH